MFIGRSIFVYPLRKRGSHFLSPRLCLRMRLGLVAFPVFLLIAWRWYRFFPSFL